MASSTVQKTASTYTPPFARGTHQFHIVGYSERRALAGSSSTTRSSDFDVGDHTWALVCGFDDQGHLASISLELLTEDITEDVLAVASLRIDDPLRRWPGALWRSEEANSFADDNRSWKLPVPADVLHGQEERYVMDDCLTILCTVDVFDEHDAQAPAPKSKNCFVAVVPPPTISGDLFKLISEESESEMRPDVTFVVKGTEIQAHRLVLAMRSKVFALEFPLHAKAKAKHARVKIDDMSASTFRAMIHFIYTDELPKELSIEALRNLLVAADRYDLQRLRLMCENMLSENIDVESVLPTLMVVHGRRSCQQLEASCIEYLASSPDVYAAAVEATKEYTELEKRNSFFVEIERKVDAHRSVASNSSSSEIDSHHRWPEKTMSTFNLSMADRGTHEFVIRNFSTVQKIHDFGRPITSGTFQVGGYDWKLIVYPSGSWALSKEHARKYISVYLQLLTDPAAARVRTCATFKMEDPSEKSPPCIKYAEHVFTDESTNWGEHGLSTLKNTKSHYLAHDGSLTIHCYLMVTNEQACSRARTTATGCGAMILVPPSNLAWHLEQLLLSEQGSDVRFVVEKRSILAHSLVIAARSPNLYETTKKHKHIVRIEGMKAMVFKAMLHFIYTDELPADCTMMAEEMLVAACRFRLDRMKTMCENLLAESMSEENALNMLKIACRHTCPDLKEYCIDFISLPHVAKDLIKTLSKE